MALTAYQQQVQRLLNDEQNQFYNLADLTTYINLGRGQIATQTESLISTVSKTILAAASTFALSSLTAPTGLKAAINVRSISRNPGTGAKTLMEGRSWQWFQNYYNTGAASIATGAPAAWAIQQQGAAGTVFFNPAADAGYTLYVESTWVPIDLVDDTTAEALSYPWTDCVPYFGAYFALIQAQRMGDAEKLMSLYNNFVLAAKLGVTPGTMPLNFPTLKALQSGVDMSPSPGGAGGRPAARSEGSIG